MQRGCVVGSRIAFRGRWVIFHYRAPLLRPGQTACFTDSSPLTRSANLTRKAPRLQLQTRGSPTPANRVSWWTTKLYSDAGCGSWCSKNTGHWTGFTSKQTSPRATCLKFLMASEAPHWRLWSDWRRPSESAWRISSTPREGEGIRTLRNMVLEPAFGLAEQAIANASPILVFTAGRCFERRLTGMSRREALRGKGSDKTLNATLNETILVQAGQATNLLTP